MLVFQQTRKFFIKVLVRNESLLNVRNPEFEDMGYNLKRDGWLNSFVDVHNQSMREEGMPWRGAREKGPDFFSILFSALTDKDDIVMDWQCGVGMFLISLFSILNLSSQLVSFSIFSRSLTFAQLVLLGGSAPFNGILSLWSLTSTSTNPSCSPCVSPTTITPHSTWAHNGDRCLLLLPARWQSVILICCVRKSVIGFELAFLSFISSRF
jgi:hypothetical protein